jgi:hypothetical protein
LLNVMMLLLLLGICIPLSEQSWGFEQAVIVPNRIIAYYIC